MINYTEKIPNNVDLGRDRVLQRALEHWQPAFLDITRSRNLLGSSCTLAAFTANFPPVCAALRRSLSIASRSAIRCPVFAASLSAVARPRPTASSFCTSHRRPPSCLKNAMSALQTRVYALRSGTDGIHYRIRGGERVSRRAARTRHRRPPDEGVNSSPGAPT